MSNQPTLGGKIIESKAGMDKVRNRILVGTPTLGNIRMEWAAARYTQIVPPNFSKAELVNYMQGVIPLRFSVADGQNVIVQEAVEGKYEWLLLIEDDTMPPPDAFMRFNEYIRDGAYPVVSGLYFTRSVPSEPLVYRGLGTSYYDKWKMGDRVWVDGVPTGCLLVSVKILKLMYKDSPEYQVMGGPVVRRVFETPARTWFNEQKGVQETLVGTSDLDWCDKVLKGDYLAKAGWKDLAKKKYPFIVDTNIFCRHIDPDGTQFPHEIPEEFL